MDEPVAKKLVKRVKAGAEVGVGLGRQHGAVVAETIVRHGRAALKTRTGKRAATGAAAGAVIGGALPFITFIGGAMLGAGALVLWKSMNDKD